jgi:hypothetical protein
MNIFSSLIIFYLIFGTVDQRNAVCNGICALLAIFVGIFVAIFVIASVGVVATSVIDVIHGFFK